MSQNLSTGAIIGISAVAGAVALFLFATRKKGTSNSNDDSSEYDISRQGGTRRNRNKQNKSRRK